jgi:O-antigen ligase
MDEILGNIFSYGLPLGALLVVTIMFVVAIGFAASWSRYIVFGLVVIMLLIPQASNYGTLDGNNAASSIFWIKGTKTFFFSFLEMALFCTWLFGAVIATRLSIKPSQNNASPLSIWYLVFGLLFTGHVVSTAFAKTDILVEFANMGIINVLKQGMFITMLFATIRNQRDLKILTLIIIICIAGRETWGLFRYIFLGGDPQNAYSNLESLNVKITFFDINDSILAALALGLCIWKLLVNKVVGWHKFAYACLTVLALLIPILSSRRTAQGGLLLAMILLVFLLPKKQKIPLLILLAISIPLSLSTLALRSADSNKSILEKIFLDVKTDPNVDPRKTRFYELQTAWDTIKEEPFFGVGPSGSFKVSSPIGLEYHKGNYTFVHSGFGHVLLKTGFVGLFIFLSIFITYVWQITKGWSELLPEYKAIVVGCLCGFVAQMPNMIGGTPIIEVRTMLVSGFLFAIPLICLSLSKRIPTNKLGKSNKISDQINKLNLPNKSHNK